VPRGTSGFFMGVAKVDYYRNGKPFAAHHG